MKNVKAIRMISAFIFLSLLLLAMPLAPVSAQVARSIDLEPQKGRIADKVTVIGEGFNKSTADTGRYAAVYLSSQEATTMHDIGTQVTTYELVKEGVWLDSDGSFKASFIVPSKLNDGKISKDVTNGTYYVYVCHYQSNNPAVIAPRIRAVATFTVTKGEISRSPITGTVGTLVEVTGTDFPSLKDISFKYDGLSVPIESGSKRTGSAGGFISVIRIPDSTAGTHIITAIASGTEVSANFRVKPEITTSPTSGEVNSRLTISGTGFGSGTQVDIWFQNIKVATVTTNSLGSFSRTFGVPDLGAGVYTVDAEGEANTAKTRFNIIVPVSTPAPTPTPSPTPGPTPPPAISASSTSVYVGQGIVISGTGFRGGGMIAIKYDDRIVGATTADGNGLFAASFAVPSSKYGAHTVTASDGTNTSELKFDVESTPPPVPSLLSPQTGAKVTSPMRFYWQNVTDDSLPVTYTIQIATSPDFSAASTVLEKTGLTKTEYALTEQEGLRLGTGEKPLYWRVKALDGASNEGNWANTGTFYVVSGGMPTWAIIIIAIIGALFLFGLGYLISMKTKP